MLEALLQAKPVVIPQLPPIMLLDAGTASDLIGSKPTFTLNTGASVDSTVLIDGHPTWKLSTTAAQVKVAFEKVLNLDTIDWTVEWSVIDTNVSTTYSAILDILNASLAQGISCRFNDGPYNNRLMFGAVATGTTDSFTVDVTQNQIQNLLTRFAFQCKAGRLTFYVNGTPMLSRVGTTGTFSATSQPKSGTLTAESQILIGYRASGVPGFIGNMGRIRISDYARYAGTYTPQAF
jgi:hypothetical protein